MPDPTNQNDQNTNQDPPTQVIPPSDPINVAPPTIPDFQSADSSATPPMMQSSTLDNIPPVIPVVEESIITPSEDQGSSAPSDLPPVTPSSPKKKFGGGKIIATILGFLVLAGGIAGGVILTQQNQDVRERAGGGGCQESGCGSSGLTCNESTGKCMCGSRIGCPDGQTCKSNQCKGDSPDDCTATNPDRCGGSCTNVKSDDNNCGNCGTKCATGQSCKDGRCLISNPPGAPIGCSGITTSCPEGWTQVSEPASGSQAYCNAQGQQCKNYRVECKINGGTTHCFLREEAQCGGTCGGQETPPPPTAQCQNVKAYSTTWAPLTATQLSQLKATNQVNFCVAGTTTQGTFDKGKFTINGVAQAETTTQRPGSTDFCQLYTIPAGTNTFNISAQIHHPTLGWK